MGEFSGVLFASVVTPLLAWEVNKDFLSANERRKVIRSIVLIMRWRTPRSIRYCLNPFLFYASHLLIGTANNKIASAGFSLAD